MTKSLYRHSSPTLSPLLLSTPFAPSSLLISSSIFSDLTSSTPVHVWSSLPPSQTSPSRKDEPFIVIAYLPPPSNPNIVVYHSLESSSTKSPPSRDEIASAVELVLNSLAETKALLVKEGLRTEEEAKEMLIAGFNELWVDALVEDGFDGAGLIKYGFWMAPLLGINGGEEFLRRVEKQEEDWSEAGYLVREGKESDVQAMSSTSKIPRAPTYLLSRLPSSSVLTLSPTASLPDPPPLAWILTGAHGSLSTLYVLPSHRRLGLAKHVVAHRMRAMSRHGDKLRPWCCVEDGGGNVASEGVWKSLGWEKRERGCYWVALGKLWAM